MKTCLHSLCLTQLFIVIAFTGFAQSFSSSELPIVVITTGGNSIPDEPKIGGTMGIIYNGPGVQNNITDPFNHFNGAIGIETRGNSTQGFDKKTYSVETQDGNGEGQSAALLGMGKEEDWILHAMVIDKSHLRIPMSFYLFQRMGHYASNWRYVEVVINGNYRGLYILTEKIKRDDDRVDIAKLSSTELTGDDVTGGYILRIDWLEDDPEGFESEFNSQGGDPMFYQWYYPKASKIQNEQKAYIKGFMDDFEEGVFANNFMNSQGKRYTKMINVTSFTDFLLINELSKNADGYKLSSYLHKDKDSKGGLLHAGPIWDFDQTYGVSLVCSNDDPTGWTYLQNQAGCEDTETMPRWWGKMMSDPVFINHLACRWQTLRMGPLHQDSLEQWIDDHVAEINNAIDRNFIRWPNFIGEAIWEEPEPIPQSYNEEVIYLKNWLANRLTWLDANMPGNCAENVISVNPIEVQETIKAYPNPVSNLLFVEAWQGEVSLTNLKGQVVYREKAQEDIHELDVSNFEPGVYILSLIGDRKMDRLKIVVQ